MNFLEERIQKDGVVKEGNVLKVDSFLNHQMDIRLLEQMGEEFKRRFASENINKIVTIEASGIGTGDNLFFINRFSAASRIFSKLPYVDKAKVTRALPNRVTITIQESSAMAYVQADGGYWVLDQNCKLLKSVTESELTGLARVDGITPVEPKVGEVLSAGDADAPKVTYLAAILGQLLTRDMASKVTVIDLSDASNPGFTYDGRFTVRSARMKMSSTNSVCCKARSPSSRPAMPAPSTCRSTNAHISAPADCSQKKIDLIRKTI